MVRRYIHNEEILIDQCVYPADKTLHQERIEECHKHEKVNLDFFIVLLMLQIKVTHKHNTTKAHSNDNG